MQITTRGPDETRTVGERIGALLEAGDCLALVGELGAGKTVLASGLLAGLGVTDQVTSPTFTLVNEYYGRLPAYHFDLYRLEHPAELEQIGFDEYLMQPGVVIIEWTDRFPGLALPDHLEFRLCATGPDQRQLTIVAYGAGAVRRLESVERVLSPC
ncbi:MAG: tRNA (adenosine(37)-N6)-threonylcarbamoyltransferase complex ATPase subunit type 1 TsaE [Bacillota bacterium]